MKTSAASPVPARLMLRVRRNEPSEEAWGPGEYGIAAVARTPGVVEHRRCSTQVKARRQGRLKGADSNVVSAEQMQISRLRAELARVKTERDILGKATAYFAKVHS